MYSCLKCNKIFKHQSNVVRHVTVTKCAKDIKEKAISQCQKCKKIFQFICRLKSHVQNHCTLTTFSVYNQTLRRQDHFMLHLKNCIVEKLVPSFVPNVTNSDLDDTSNNTYQNKIHG